MFVADFISGKQEGLPDRVGVQVVGMAADSPVRQHDIRVGDIIIAVADKPVGNKFEFERRLFHHRPGERVTLTIHREAPTAAAFIDLATQRANAGHVPSIALLGRFYSTSDAKVDMSRAFAWTKRAAEKGRVYAMRVLADKYAFGWGVTADMSKSLKWLRAAADRGSLPAISHLGRTYANGWSGVTKNLAQAYNWYVKAASSGDSHSAQIMAEAYDNGAGVPRNPDKASLYLYRAFETLNFEPAAWKCRLSKVFARRVGDLSQYTAATRKGLQSRLTTAGYYTGNTNGTVGRAMTRALEELALTGGKKPNAEQRLAPDRLLKSIDDIKELELLD